jgi:predicted extracellular nuclease
MVRPLNKIFTVFLILAIAFAIMPKQLVSAATPTELFFSEYIEGSSNNKALEIYNGTGSAINLGTSGYNVQMYFNGSGSATLTINLSGTVANGDVFVLAQSSANATILAQADQTNGSGWFNGDDVVVLRKGTTVIDVVGQIGFDPGSEWGSGLTSTADNTLRRKDTICTGDTNGADVFDPSLEWEGFATDTFGGLGSHTANCSAPDTAPTVTSSYPTDGAADIPLNANMSVTFNEPVNVSGSWFDITCSVSGAHSGVASGGPTTFTINPNSDFVGGETCTFKVLAPNVSDQDSNDPPDTMVFDFTVGFTTFDVCVQPYTSIPSIQGSGATVALTGTRTTQGVVVADYEGASPNLRGFFIQDPIGDGNPATSDGIFVFEGSNANTVSIGDVVRVTGNAGENQGQSQISVGTIVKCGTGSVAPTDVTFPVASADFLEQYEGMLVRLPQTMYVTEHFQLGRFGEVLLSANGRLQQPTNVVAPGAPANALQAANNLNQIFLDDGTNTQNPDPIVFARGGQPLSASNTLRGGDTATGIVGVLNYTWGGASASPNAYRVRPVNAMNGYVNFEASNPRPTSAPEVGGTLKVVGMNLLNFFNTFDGLPDNVDNCTLGVGGGATDCRGADTQDEFTRQIPKTVAAILAMNPDVLGVNEIENDGYGPDSAIALLVNELNAATAPGTYAYIDVDSATGQVNALGGDAIKVGMIYKPASVTPVGTTAVLNTNAFITGGDSDPRNRASLAQAFQQNANGEVFIVNINHLKSKGSACNAPDAGDGQGNCNQVRVNAVNELMAWLASNPTGTDDPDILLVGDYNSYAMEDPITTLENGGFTHLIKTFIGADAYSYVFDGQWGYLDHALATASMTSQVSGVADYHINSDEPSVLDYNTNFKSVGQIASLYVPDQFRVSDHDPVLVGLCLPPSLDVTVTPDSLFPVNHKYVDVNATLNASSDTTSITLLSVTSNEADDSTGDGKTINDIVIVDNDTFQLRAERAGNSNDRVYTITYQATNSCGATTIATATVTVPHNK